MLSVARTYLQQLKRGQAARRRLQGTSPYNPGVKRRLYALSDGPE